MVRYSYNNHATDFTFRFLSYCFRHHFSIVQSTVDGLVFVLQLDVDSVGPILGYKLVLSSSSVGITIKISKNAKKCRKIRSSLRSQCCMRVFSVICKHCDLCDICTTMPKRSKSHVAKVLAEPHPSLAICQLFKTFPTKKKILPFSVFHSEMFSFRIIGKL